MPRARVICGGIAKMAIKLISSGPCSGCGAPESCCKTAQARHSELMDAQQELRRREGLAVKLATAQGEIVKLRTAIKDGSMFFNSALKHGPLPGTPWQDGAEKMLLKMEELSGKEIE